MSILKKAKEKERVVSFLYTELATTLLSAIVAAIYNFGETVFDFRTPWDSTRTTSSILYFRPA